MSSEGISTFNRHVVAGAPTTAALVVEGVKAASQGKIPEIPEKDTGRVGAPQHSARLVDNRARQPLCIDVA